LLNHIHWFFQQRCSIKRTWRCCPWFSVQTYWHSSNLSQKELNISAKLFHCHITHH